MSLGQAVFRLLCVIDRVWLPPGVRLHLCNVAFYEGCMRRLRPELPPVTIGQVLGVARLSSGPRQSGWHWERLR